MKLQVLVATMNNFDIENLYRRMNLKTDVLIINQSDSVNYVNKKINNSTLECYTFNERGLSKSRNNALLRCSGDIICIADDDMTYTDSYNEDIINEFKKHPEADVIVFNVSLKSTSRKGIKITKFAKVKKIESRKYSSVNIAIKHKALLSTNIYFNTLFGSGSKYKCGEDTIFLKELLDKKVKIYKSPINIATVDMSNSTWFDGYTKEYFFNKGALIACCYPKLTYLLVFIQALKNSKKKLGSYLHFFKLFNWYCKGAKDYKNIKKASDKNE